MYQIHKYVAFVPAPKMNMSLSTDPISTSFRFMDLNKAEVDFFIDQAVRGLLSIGFTDADAQFVNTTLDTVFNGRCAPARTVIPENQGPQLQAICIAADCDLALNDTCSAYDPAVAPLVANSTLVGNYTKNGDGTTIVNISTTTTGSSAGPSVTAGSHGASPLTERGMELGVAIVLAFLFMSMMA